jgi:hypothetical protein
MTVGALASVPASALASMLKSARVSVTMSD